MSLSTLIDRVALALLRGRQYESKFLRRRFKKSYQIEIGDYSIGAFDSWRIAPETQIGRYCSIASSARVINANHPMGSISTHPYLYVPELGVVSRSAVKNAVKVIGDDVWMGHNAIITPACRAIGRGAVVGAGAIVMDDVPPYAVVAGSPARIIRFRFSPDVIAAIEATRWWELDRAALARGLAAVPAFGERPTVESAKQFYFAVHGRELDIPDLTPASASEVELARPLTAEDIIAVAAQDYPDLVEADLDKPISELAIDSFGFINLRVGLESRLGGQISDAAWARMNRLRDLTRLGRASDRPEDRAAEAARSGRDAEARVSAASDDRLPGTPPPHEVVRRISINMPQMALSGLSEAWLFKELGDMHWSALTRSLGVTPVNIKDSLGDRLYATFTRFSVKLDNPLADFCEDDELSMRLGLSRFGAGLFFGEAMLSTPTAGGRAQLMTTFSKFGEAGKNTSLLKGQPFIPEDCTTPVLAEMPAFSLEYRAQRSEAPPPAIWSCEYEILPSHDINGVGLLYFAAYPIIADLCVGRYAGAQRLAGYSTIEKEVFYFANATPDETLVFHLHDWVDEGGRIRYQGALHRRSDEAMMALVRAEKVAIR